MRQVAATGPVQKSILWAKEPRLVSPRGDWAVRFITDYQEAAKIG